MYRIVIVDDEPLILSGISSLLNWEEFNCRIVGKATDGEAAFRIIKETQPDILITDISMPVLSGIDLIQKCKDENLCMSFLVLTNLEEFHLVRQALSLGVVDYLLKISLTPELMEEALNKAVDAFRLTMSTKPHRFIDNAYRENQDVSAPDFFNLLIDYYKENANAILPSFWEKMNIAAMARRLNLDHVYCNYCCILINLYQKIDIFNSEEVTTIDIDKIQPQILDIINTISLRYFSDYCIIPYQSGEFLMLGNIPENNVPENHLEHYFPKLLESIKTYFGLELLAGASCTHARIREIDMAIREAQTALHCYYYHSTSSVQYFGAHEVHFKKTSKFNINFLKPNLTKCMEFNDGSGLQHIFDEITTLFTDYKPSKKQAIDACINLYSYLNTFFYGSEEKQSYFPSTIDIAYSLDQFKSLSEIVEWLNTFSKRLSGYLDLAGDKNHEKLIVLTKQYIEEHYQEKLSLSQIATAINISPGYLSNSFKRSTNINLSDYIAQIKIEHAKMLIDSNKYLIYEISDMLGFETPYYFSTVFKKVTGCSPKAYAKHLNL